MYISTNALRKLLMDLLEEHAPSKLGGMFCSCSLCKQGGQLIADLDQHKNGALILKEEEKKFPAEVKIVEDLSFNFRKNLEQSPKGKI